MSGDRPVLYTRRVVVAPSVPEDRDDFIALERDADVMRYLNGGAVDHSVTDPLEAPFLMPRGGEPDVWSIRLRHSGAFVGWLSFRPVDNGQAELGYRLCKSAWGQGLATESAGALVAWGLERAGYGRITAQTMAVNQASRRVMEKIGMRYVRTEYAEYADPIAGSELGEVIYALVSG